MNRKQQTVLITLGANGILIALRFILAFVSGSIALKANAWHSVADLVVMGIVYLGLLFATRQDERYKWLIGRTENIVAIIVALFISYMGFELFYEAIAGEAIELRYVAWASLGAFLGVCITYFMGRYLLYVGNQEKSPSLIAAGYHARMDMLCSSAVLIGLTGSIFGMTGLDKVAATIVVIFIFVASLEILMVNVKAMRSNADVVPDEGFEHGHSRIGWLVTVGLLLVAGYFASGLYSVRPGEQAVVRQFGRISSVAAVPGLHYRWPYPVERVDIVPAARVQLVTTDQKLLLTGDENLIEVAITVHYRVKDAALFLLNVTDPEQVVRNAAESSVRSVVGRNAIDLLLAEGRSKLQEETQQAISIELDSNRVGLEVTGVLIRYLAPPDEVKAAFQDVASAREDRITYINEGHSFYNALVPKARGEAAENLLSAAAYKTEKIDSAEGEATRFLKRTEEYAQAREITRTRLYLEAMEKVLPGVKKCLMGAGTEIDGTDLWFTGPYAEAPFIKK
ncbi:MAG TPA: FtsH protease activity modulator HflK [Lentisphaeria bacterium]|nr:MAG: HflK protein [Lentisphaerae bacterium GWF2_49_21]HBC86441.1 FtsH protease activity modulator HflK [Lentisphaeria bacterium]